MAFSLRVSPSCYMIADSTSPPPPPPPSPAELPPGLLEEYLQSMREQLGVLVELADRLGAAGNDREALDALRRETHKIHGSAGSYGFWGVSRLAAGMEATVKDWAARPDEVDADRGSLARWFVARLADGLKLEVPSTSDDHRPRASRTQPTSAGVPDVVVVEDEDRKSTRLNSSHVEISYAVFCL